MRVLILGGGVIGASAAYRLAVRGAEVTVVERSAVACAASGKSGGFLALDWCDGTPLRQLARRSFALHDELAGTLNGERWGYRRLGPGACWPASGGANREAPAHPCSAGSTRTRGYRAGSALRRRRRRSIRR